MSAALALPHNDVYALNRELDRTKSQAFIGKNAAFVGSLLCSLNFHWDDSIPTAATDALSIFWNPEYFLKLPKRSRETEQMHELLHVGLLHLPRRGNRDHKIWNIACDIAIDLMLEADAYSFEGIEGVLTFPNLDARKYKGWAEEDIYNDLIANSPPPPPNSYTPDIRSCDPKDLPKIINNVIRAVQQAKLGGGAGNIPGKVEEHLSVFLKPVIPWENILHRFMSDLSEDSYTWRKPNRRFSDMYLPSKFTDDGRLDHLCYYEDVSGSLTTKDVIRFNSEFKYVKDVFNPRKATLVQFDTRITQEVVFDENTPFKQVQIVGRGGTCLIPVREHIIKHQPTAAIIFTDLQCAPMEPLPFDIPIIWVAIKAHGATVPFGELVHINN